MKEVTCVDPGCDEVLVVTDDDYWARCPFHAELRATVVLMLDIAYGRTKVPDEFFDEDEE